VERWEREEGSLSMMKGIHERANELALNAGAILGSKVSKVRMLQSSLGTDSLAWIEFKHSLSRNNAQKANKHKYNAQNERGTK
jgi:hypothetical protein